MEQEINLYLHIPNEYRNRVTIQQLSKVFGLWLAVLAIIFFYQKTQMFFATRAFQKIVAEKRIQQEILLELKAKYKKPVKSVALQTQRDELNKTLNLHTSLAQDLNQPQVSNITGFSKYLQAFSIQDVPSVWLNEISIQKGGTEITLSGLTKDITSVRQFMQRLSGDPVFSNYELKLKQVETSLVNPGNENFTILINQKMESIPQN